MLCTLIVSGELRHFNGQGFGEPSEWQAGPHSRDKEGQQTQVSFLPPPSSGAAAKSPAEHGHISITRIKSYTFARALCYKL